MVLQRKNRKALTFAENVMEHMRSSFQRLERRLEDTAVPADAADAVDAYLTRVEDLLAELDDELNILDEVLDELDELQEAEEAEA